MANLQGGDHQPPIWVIHDVTLAGYNALIGHRSFRDNTKAQKKTAFIAFWETPEVAATWAQAVLGDMQIDDKKQSETQAGLGLTGLLHACSPFLKSVCVKSITDYIHTLIQQPQSPTADALLMITAPHINITPNVIDVIKRLPNPKQTLAIEQLAIDIATQRLIEEALIMERLLRVGSQIPVVANIQPAVTFVNKKIEQLEQDIQHLLFQNKLHNHAMSQTTDAILSMNNDAELRLQPPQGLPEIYRAKKA